MEKEKKVTIRLSESEHNRLKEETDKEGVSISGYLRSKLFNDIKNNVPQNLYYREQMDLQDIRRELVNLEYCIERLPHIKNDSREYMKERIENIWLMLK